MELFGPTSDVRRRNRIVIGCASVVLMGIVGVGVLTDGGSDDATPATAEEEPVSSGPTPLEVSACRLLHASAGTMYLGRADLDGDGSSDRIVVGPTGREIWIEPARARGAGSPAVVLPDAAVSVLDAVDLDGVGGDEVFVSIAGTEGAGPGVILTYDADACQLRLVDTDGGPPLVFATLAGGGITCTTVDQRVEVVIAAVGAGDDPTSRDEVRYRVRDGSAEPAPISFDRGPSAAAALGSRRDRDVTCSSALAGEVLAASCDVISPIPNDKVDVIGEADVDGDGAPDAAAISSPGSGSTSTSTSTRARSAR